MSKHRKSIEGKVNRIIDEIMHPHFQKYPATILLDGLLHALVEQDPETSLKKFIRYNTPELMKRIGRKKEKVENERKLKGKKVSS